MEYNEKVLLLLSERKMSRREFAALINVSLSFLSNVLNGKKKFSRETEGLLIKNLELPRDYFVDENLKTVTIDEQMYFNQLFPDAIGTPITLDRVRKIIKAFKD